MATSNINLNHADTAQLRQIGLDENAARAVIDARPLADWKDLDRAGLDPTLIDTIRSKGAQLGEPSAGPIAEPGSGGHGGAPGGNLGRA